jgi:iron(III) transport system substrate-binding protein
MRSINFALGVAMSAACFVTSLNGLKADTSPHPWLDPALLQAAKAEGGEVIVYSTTNEEEGLPLWHIFEEATGIKVQYVRASDSQILGRVTIEARSGQKTWDIAQTANVQKFPDALLAAFEPTEAQHLFPEARGSNKRWYGVYANYNTPAYNTKAIKKEDVPHSLEDFAHHPEWAGKVVLDGTDHVWLATVYRFYGEEKARRILKDLVATVKPVVIDGHLAVARAVGAGEYWIALNNYLNLTLNQKMAHANTDYFVVDPIPLFYGQVGVSAHAPHPTAALLAANFSISQEAQEFLAKFGRFPTRDDVKTEPAGLVAELNAHKPLTVLLSGEEDRVWQKEFKDLLLAH